MTTDSLADRPPRRVALLTPYDGGNFGDAAIQDAMIANLRSRLPGVLLSGITLNSHNFLQRHGSDAFPLSALSLPFYGMHDRWQGESQPDNQAAPSQKSNRGWKSALRGLLRRIPGLRRAVITVREWMATIRDEVSHFFAGYRFLRKHQLLIVSGGGQLDDEWGGPWGHPYCVFKWALIARLAGVPFAVASVGAGKTNSRLTRFFLSSALRSAKYRSYRDANSKAVAAKMFSAAAKDPVVPDLAFSLPPESMPVAENLRPAAQGRRIVALSPIAYAKPGGWPGAKQGIYDRYKRQLAGILAALAKRGDFVVIVWSSLGDDDRMVSEILDCLDSQSKAAVSAALHIPEITDWKKLAALLAGSDFLIASRLHSTILGFMTAKPTVAISFDPKVDWVMQDVGQTASLLHIADFQAADAVGALDRLASDTNNVVREIHAYRQSVSPLLSAQYDALANLASAGATSLK